MSARLVSTSYRTVGSVAGPLLFVRSTRGIALGELAEVTLADGRKRLGQVLEIRDSLAVVQVSSGTEGIDSDRTSVRFLSAPAQVGVSLEMLGRTFDGLGRPVDGGPPILAEAHLDVNGLPINPYARERPAEFIETGVSAIDGLNSLVRGQKLPIFSAFGLPGNELAAHIATPRASSHRRAIRRCVCCHWQHASRKRFLPVDFPEFGRDGPNGAVLEHGR